MDTNEWAVVELSVCEHTDTLELIILTLRVGVLEGSESRGFSLVEDAHGKCDLDLRDLIIRQWFVRILQVRMYNGVLEIVLELEVTHIEIFQIVVVLQIFKIRKMRYLKK